MKLAFQSSLALILIGISVSVFSQEVGFDQNQIKFLIGENQDNIRFEANTKSSYINRFSSVSEKDEHQISVVDTVPETEGIIVQDGFVEKMDNYLAFRLSFTNDNERFSVDAGPTKFKIFPNGSSKLKLNLNYKFISFGISYLPKFITENDDNDLKGKTKGFGFSTQLNFSQWFQQLTYNEIKGFYLENTNDFDSDWRAGDPYVQFPNLIYRNFQGVTGYSFNPNFSTKALLTGTERQLKSVGSFVPILLYRYYLVDNRDETTSSNSTQKSNNFEILASAGYFYTYVINEKFYLSGGASAGYGLLSSKVLTRYIDDRITVKQNNGIFRYDARGTVGYNSERLFGGFIISTENSQYRQANTSVINANWRVFMQAFIGFRLHAPEFLQQKADSLPMRE